MKKIVEKLILKVKTFLKNQAKDIFVSILLILSIITYLYGYKICSFFYNSDNTYGLERKEIIKNFWELRFSLYSFIISVSYYVSTLNLSRINTVICKIGYNLAAISFIDKFIFKQFDATKYDYVIIFCVIFTQTYRYINKK